MIQQIRLPKSRCPYCEKLLDAASNLTGQTGTGPQPGDWTVCLGCAQLLVFNFDRTVRKPAPGEEEQCFRTYPHFKKQMQLIADAVRQIDRRPRPDRRRVKRNQRKKF